MVVTVSVALVVWFAVGVLVALVVGPVLRGHVDGAGVDRAGLGRTGLDRDGVDHEGVDRREGPGRPPGTRSRRAS